MIKRSLILDLCFAGIALIVFCNLNGIIFVLFGISAVLSIFILLFCLIISYYLFRYKKIIFPLWAYNTAVIFLLFFGSIMWLFYNPLHHKNADYYEVLRKTLPSLLLIYAIYKYTLYAADRGKLINVYFFTTLTLFAVTVLVPLSVTTNIFPSSFKAMMTYSNARSSGLFASPNLAGMHANFTLVFVLFFTIRSKRFYLLFLAAVPVALYASFLTFSKASIIMSGIMVILFFAYNLSIILKLPTNRRRRFGAAIIIIFVAIIAFFPQLRALYDNLNPQQLQRIEQIGGFLQGEVNTQTTTNRSDLWGEAIEMIAAQPLQGYGLSCFSNLPKGRQGCHNTYLMIWGEAGVIGIIILLVYVFSTYYRCVFWVRDPSYRFICIALFFVITIQFYGAAHRGLANSEAACILGILFGTLEAQRGRISHMIHGKYTALDYQTKLAKQNEHPH